MLLLLLLLLLLRFQAFAPLLPRLLSKAYLHAYYMGLLLYPVSI